METSVVTAFYPLAKSKHGVAKYLPWLQLFCRIPCQLVVYTDASMEAQVREWRGPLMDRTTIVIRPFYSYRMTSPAMMDIWRQHHRIDPEQRIHSPELYAVWAMKQECVRDAIERNDYPTTRWFIWCDMGIHRDPSKHAFYKTFPSNTVCSQVCSPGRIVFLEVKAIPESHLMAWKSRTPLPALTRDTTLGGGCIAGDREAWTDFGSAYEQLIEEFNGRGIFAGKDQILYFTMLMTRRCHPFCLLKSQAFDGGRGDIWMSLPVILGGQAPVVVNPTFEET
jgi:hypothetical protein